MKKRSALAEALGGIIAGIAAIFGGFIFIVAYLLSDNIIVAMIIGLCSWVLVDLLLILNKRLFGLLLVVLLKIPFFRNILSKAVNDDNE